MKHEGESLPTVESREQIATATSFPHPSHVFRTIHTYLFPNSPYRAETRSIMMGRIRSSNALSLAQIRQEGAVFVAEIRQLKRAFWRKIGAWEMHPDARDKFLVMADDCARTLGGKSFQDGIDKTRKLLAKLTELLDAVRTPELLSQRLDETNIATEQEWLLLSLFKFGPHLVRWIFSKLNETATDELPATSSRRPSIPANRQVQMLCFVNDLQFNHGVELEKAKERAARRYGCSVRTIERYWASRKQILANGPEFKFSDLIEGIKTAIESDT